ncbi:MAG: hypothetical protein RIC55_24735 [Pirellulaceae bacterium]
MANTEIENITCATFNSMSEAEQQAFVIGVANGRGMTAGLFQAYAGAAQKMARTPEEGEAIAESFATIHEMVSPLLEVDAGSLLNGVRAASRRPEFQDEFVINALASVHVDVARALREHGEQSDD